MDICNMDICNRLRSAGYEPRPAECLALRAVERAAGGVRALLLEGGGLRFL